MTPAEKRVLRAALAWWKWRRPCGTSSRFGWTEAEHLANPIVNVAGEGDKSLALAVRALVKERRSSRAK